MGGDYTRWTFDPARDYAEVFKQQGRVDLDADWNEFVEMVYRRWRAETVDIIGRAVVPESTPNAFFVTPSGPSLFTIGIGRMYVDGLLAECRGLSPLTFDPVLGEMDGTLPIPFNQQPYYPNPNPLPTPGPSVDLVYLDVWKREVIALQDPNIREKALGGPDTTTRAQTVWQVKILPNVGTQSCDGDIPAWDTLTAPSAGRLTTSTVVPAPSPDPCILSPTGGYRGLENRLYRVEIHTAGTVGGANPATFKWSRDNASVVSGVNAISASGGPNSVVTLTSLGRDQVLRFKAGDWVEILDDRTEFSQNDFNGTNFVGQPGFLTQISTTPDEANRMITVVPPVPAGLFDPTDPGWHTRLRRWDQRFTGAGSDVDQNTGLITVSAGPLDIEDGIQVSFSDDPAGGLLHVGDYWLFAARTADGSVEPLQDAPPSGILHHYARLGFMTWNATNTGTFQDCRQFWPPPFGAAEGCDCTVCVTPKGHNGGTATINKAVQDTIAKGGGKICLSPGLYLIDQTVDINTGAAIQIVGHGLAFLAPGPNLGGDPLVHVDNSVDITVQDLGFLALVPAGGVGQSLAGIVIENAAFVTVKHCSFLGPPKGTTLSPAIALTGIVLDTSIRENLFGNVEFGVALQRGKQQLIAALSIENNQMFCIQTAVKLIGADNSLFLEVRIAGNFIQSISGIALTGLGLDLTVEDNSIVIQPDEAKSGVGVFSTISQTRVANNQIYGSNTAAGNAGIQLSSQPLYGIQITGNRIAGIAGTGVLITENALLLQATIAGNQLLNLGKGGIIMAQSTAAVDLNITDNSLASVAQTVDPNDPNLPYMAGIQLMNAINTNLSGNAIENLGMDPGASGPRFAVIAFLLSGTRIAGNRIQNIGPIPLKGSGFGIAMEFVGGRVDVADNEIRRSLTPNPDDPSLWTTLEIVACPNDVSIRGNLLEGFGQGHVALIGTAKLLNVSPSSCIFSENQCLLDSSKPTQPVAEITAQAVAAANNYCKSPREAIGIQLHGPFTTDKQATVGPVTVLGNLTSGVIKIENAPLGNPWAPLNVTLP